MKLERTFSLVKPDATKRNITGEVNAMIEKAGLRIVAQKRMSLSKAEAEKFYGVHKGKPFFGELVDFITSGPVIAQVLEGEDVIAKYREIMGATNFENAKEGTIRKAYATDIMLNVVHGSDSAENAEFEISLFFSEFEIVG